MFNEVYETCLPDIETILPRLAEIIEAEYSHSACSATEQAFECSGRSSAEWTLAGKTGIRITVSFEEHESYLFIKVEGKGAAFTRAKQYLYECYLHQGGNPDAQERP
jgi:hypothetical protein